MITPPSPSPTSVRAVRRQAIPLSSAELVKIAPLGAGNLPLVISPQVEGLNLVAWSRDHRSRIIDFLLQHGGILFRRFQVDMSAFEQFIQTVAGELLEYRDRSSPRRSVQGNLYISTDYPADQSIFLHSENSYAATWPLKICFYCLTPSDQGGETPIADTRKVLARIPPQVQARFARLGVLYLRNFSERLGLPWQTVFQTSERAAVEQFCRTNAIEFEWRGDRLRTRQVRQAVTRHPKTGEWIWFNHAAFFHVSTLPPQIRQAVLTEFSEADFPHNTYYGDGSPIKPQVVETIRQAYRQEQVIFPWQVGDVLLLDNMLTAHGRRPFAGPRHVIVGMAESFACQDLPKEN